MANPLSSLSLWATSPAGTKITMLTLKAFIAAGMTRFVYGAGRFFDGPIRPCGEAKYCEKYGYPRPELEYRAYIFWQSGLSISWPFVEAAGGLAARVSRTYRRL
jgi:hypothetical protein